jgi:hypothetical protein
MWQIHPLFLEMGKKFQKDNPTLWALIFMNALTIEDDGTWNIMSKQGFRDDMLLDAGMASIAEGYLQEWLPKIEKEFATFSKTMWGGSMEVIKETAKKYDKSGVDGKNLLAEDGVIFDRGNDFSYPIQGFIFVLPAQSINRANVLEVLL